MSVGVVVGIVVLHSPWSDDDGDAARPTGALTEPLYEPTPTPLDVPTKTVTVRIEVPRGGCWRATIDAEGPRVGCRSLEFPYDVQGSLSIFVERLGPPEQPVSAAIEVDGRVVQTVGPTTVQYPTFEIGYQVPAETP